MTRSSAIWEECPLLTIAITKQQSHETCSINLTLQPKKNWTELCLRDSCRICPTEKKNSSPTPHCNFQNCHNHVCSSSLHMTAFQRQNRPTRLHYSPFKLLPLLVFPLALAGRGSYSLKKLLVIELANAKCLWFWNRKQGLCKCTDFIVCFLLRWAQKNALNMSSLKYCSTSMLWGDRHRALPELF